MTLGLLFLFQEFGCFFSDHQQKAEVNVQWIYACVYQLHTSKATIREQHSSTEYSCLLLIPLRSDEAQNCFQIQSKLVHQEAEYRLCYLYLFLYYNRIFRIQAVNNLKTDQRTSALSKSQKDLPE